MDKNTQNHKNARHRLLNLERETIFHDFTFELISRIILVRKEVI